ncbi:MAG: Modification methylase MjaV [Methanoregula sp. PtaU1.Bin051]|nr:MAG: Modification methylase MjaV [Methanoregula sp. PtaU1.Bin051]
MSALKRFFTVYNCDCIYGARKYLPDGSVDLIVTDPPYGINGDRLHRHYNRNEEFVIGDYVEISKEKYAGFTDHWIRQAERVLRPGGSIYIVSGYTNLADILNALRKTSLKEVNHIIWKFRFGVFTKNKYISSHYHILFYEKPGGNRTFNPESRFGFNEKDANRNSLNNTDREDVWLINREYKPGRIKNKNELPIALLTKIIQYSSNEGDLVCDFFLGGFSTAKVAIGLNRRIVGFEISRPVFIAKSAELETIRPGSMICNLRKPNVYSQKNRGRSWSEEEYSALMDGYDQLLSDGLPRYRIIALLEEQLGRGRWGIEKALKKIGRGSSRR